jgi:hypothetical protein
MMKLKKEWIMKKWKPILQLRSPDWSRPGRDRDLFEKTRTLQTDMGFRMTWRWILIVIFTIISFLGCSSNKLDSLPQELLGRWETTASKYKGFSFELTKEFIIFTDLNAENRPEVYTIEKRTKDIDKDNNAVYAVFYKNNEGLELKFALYYDPAEGGKIILKNQKGTVWTRSTTS